MRIPFCLGMAMVLLGGVAGGEPLQWHVDVSSPPAEFAVRDGAWAAEVVQGGVILHMGRGGGTQDRRQLVADARLTLHTEGGDPRWDHRWPPQPMAARYSYAMGEGKDAPAVNADYARDPDSGGLRLSHEVTSPEKGVWGIEWRIAGVPLDMNIIVPATSGLKLTQDSPDTRWSFDYPIVWTNQMVIIEGDGGGVCVWAEDTEGAFKRLVVERGEDGWRLGVITMAYAPFSEADTVPSVLWHIEPYEGDWRVPARRYRDWMAKHFRLTPVAEQSPGWVKDTRACVIMGQDMEVLEALATRVDPAQTMIYLPGWRADGYDRNYPEYANILPEVKPFIDRAHELGFRIMLHVNYFGCDPLHPLYEKFEPYQIRDPFTKEKQWWLWERADPVIKFAYINPAYEPWRDEFVGRMVALRDTLDMDAIHIDQTLCIFNDHHGRIDGMTMMDGARAIHRALREALPEVAVSGEGLNEISMVGEAFAQRHAHGMNHADGTFNVDKLRMAHPIASYLMSNYTLPYGYLGVAPPTMPDLYCAWDEAYRHQGVVPALKPNLAELRHPTGFTRQFLDEAAFFMGERVVLDMEGDWPAEVAFPYRTAKGEAVRDMKDGRLLHGDACISRMVRGVSTMPGPGSIDGWRGYNKDGIIGLEPSKWYPCFDDPRDMSLLHLERIPEGFTIGAVTESPELACVRTRPALGRNIHLADLFSLAECGTWHFADDERPTVKGAIYQAEDGAYFRPEDFAIWAHPPWQGGAFGVVYGRFPLTVPRDATRFVSEVALAVDAVGESKSDGVTFSVTVRADGMEETVSLHQADSVPKPLTLDLRAFAGKDVVVELTAHPGPEKSPSFDWARWQDPRIEVRPEVEATTRVGGVKPWRYVLSSAGLSPLDGQETVELESMFPGAIYFLREPPALAALPLDLTAAGYHVSFASDAGMSLKEPRYAGVTATTVTVGGVELKGLTAHTPGYGRTQADFPMWLPERRARFSSTIGLRDGAVDGDVIFIVEVNGQEIARKRMLPGAGETMACDLGPWAGQPVIFSLVTDANGPNHYDWAHWGAPEIQ